MFVTIYSGNNYKTKKRKRNFFQNNRVPEPVLLLTRLGGVSVGWMEQRGSISSRGGQVGVTILNWLGKANLDM